MDAVNWHSFFFYLLAAITCVFAVGVVVSSNIVRMAFYLIISLGATAGLFFLAGAPFVGAMQLMIYVGGTLVLLVFGVMLTAQGPFVSLKTGGGEWVVAFIVGGSLLAVLLQAAFSVDVWRGQPLATTQEGRLEFPKTDDGGATIGMPLLGIRTDADDVQGTASGYLLPFEIVSVHLLVVLIGAAYLARTKKRAKRSEDGQGATDGPAQTSPTT